MPQMYPMNWFIIFLFLLLCLYFTTALVHTTLTTSYPAISPELGLPNVMWLW